MFKVTAADGKVTSYQYDDLGRITRVTYPDGHSTQTQYDANGNAVAVIVPSLEQHDFTVNGVGNTASETRPVNSTTRYVYNRDKQLTAIELPAGDRIEYGYQNGRLASTQMPEGTSEYLYQQGDQLKEVKEGTEKVNYSYDGSLLTSMQYSGELNSSLSYGYNNDLQVNSLSYAGGSTSLSYDKDGLVTGIHGFAISYRADNGLPELLKDGKLSQSWLWNGYGEATSVQYQLDNLASTGYQLEYNSVGQIVRKTERELDGSALVSDYTYDDRYRLTEVKQNGTVTEAYQFDANGNRIGFSSLLRGVNNQSASYTHGDQLAQSGNATYSYDGNGRLASKTTTENSISKATQYQYSSSGRLLAVTTPEKAITYRHNALGQRVAKLVKGVVVEKYLWQDLTTLLAVYNPDDSVKQRFEYGLGHTPVSFTQSGQRYYIQTDHLGSPRVISNSSGVVVKAIRYDSYGNVISDSHPAFNLPFGFAGGLVDADTKLIRFGYRDYDPETGRWTARDPIGFAGGDTNLYGYVLGDPVNFMDRGGMAGMDWLWGAIYNATGGATLPQGAVDAAAGFGDGIVSAVTLDLVDLGTVREKFGTDGSVNKNSSHYKSSKKVGEGYASGVSLAGAARSGYLTYHARKKAYAWRTNSKTARKTRAKKIANAGQYRPIISGVIWDLTGGAGVAAWLDLFDVNMKETASDFYDGMSSCN
ncbi:RHS repeat domain-containing protein [Rheinheimera sp. SA_1]|uniref:RHS repeat domain-containing protein n=1 Tax=Rheinheimera sp. SA_1 TaxID=1827365 RepID=UPI0018D2DA0E|nr:RHS repeat-associated core domain-containing protein [Rheinheimera sp. SA_1]